MITITLCNQKGGVGKSTTASTTAAGLSRRGFRVLAVDVDPQHNLSSICASQALPNTITDVITGKQPTAAAIQPTVQGFDILPGDLDLSTLPAELRRLDMVKKILDPVRNKYDYCIIDTPPALSIITMAAIVAASVVVIPAHPDVLSLYGIDQVADTINAIRPYNQDLRSVGILITGCNYRRKLDRTMIETIKARAQEMSAIVYNTTIRTTVAVPEAQLMRIDLFSSAPRAGVTADYNAFIDELLKGANNG